MILVVAEHQGGQVHRASWEAIAAAQRLGSPVTVLVPGHGVDHRQSIEDLEGEHVSERPIRALFNRPRQQREA